MSKKQEQAEANIGKSSEIDVIELRVNEKIISKEKRLIIPKQAFKYAADTEFLQGRTLQVYWFLLEKKQAGISEIQKGLNFSSSGLVAYQINKLVKAGLIVQDEVTSKYFVNQKVQPGVLSFYIQVGNYLLPRVSLYLVIFLSGFLIFMICSLIFGDEFISQLGSILFLFLLIIGSILLSYESTKLNQLKPYNKTYNDEKID